MKSIINKILLKFYYWWYIVTRITEWEEGTTVGHPYVTTQFKLLYDSISYQIHTFQPFPVPVYLWLISHNPFHTFELKVTYDMEQFDFIEFDEILVVEMKKLGLERGDSGAGCGFRDIWFRGRKPAIRRAVLYIDTKYPSISQVNELDDAEFLGVGY